MNLALAGELFLSLLFRQSMFNGHSVVSTTSNFGHQRGLSKILDNPLPFKNTFCFQFLIKFDKVVQNLKHPAQMKARAIIQLWLSRDLVARMARGTENDNYNNMARVTVRADHVIWSVWVHRIMSEANSTRD